MGGWTKLSISVFHKTSKGEEKLFSVRQPSCRHFSTYPYLWINKLIWQLVSVLPHFLDFEFFFSTVRIFFRRNIFVGRVVSINIVLNQLFELFELIFYTFGLIFYFWLHIFIFDLIFYYLDILSATERHSVTSSAIYYICFIFMLWTCLKGHSGFAVWSSLVCFLVWLLFPKAKRYNFHDYLGIRQSKHCKSKFNYR